MGETLVHADLEPVVPPARDVTAIQVLTDKATGIDNHPQPVTQIPPLVTEGQYRAENPYSH